MHSMVTQTTTGRRAMSSSTSSSSSSPKKVAFDIPTPGHRQVSWSGSSTPSGYFDDENDYHLTPSQKRSRRVLRALERLQPNSPTRPRLPLKLTPYPSRSSTPRPGILRKSSGTSSEINAAEVLKSAITKIRVPTPRQNTLKRRRQARYTHDSDDSDASDEPSPIKKVCTNQKSPKRVRLDSNVQPRSPTRPSKRETGALHLSTRPHPAEDRDDQWYTTMFRRLYRMTERFVDQHFGMHDLTSADVSQEPWALDMSPEFLDWAEQVAEEDPHQDGWDGILKCPRQRKWLIMGILMRIIRAKVFDSTLWGATEEQKRMVTGLDRELLSKEGFSRTELRAKIVRSIIGQASVTQNFFPEVANLTAQISLLLRPLSDYLSSTPSPHPSKPLPNSKDQYQSLHNIISTAAYLSLCIRLSPSIFNFRDIPLGGTYDPEDQHNLEPEHYNLSKRSVLERYTLAKTQWVESRSAALEIVQALSDEGKEATKAGRKAAQALHDILAVEPQASAQTHRPMCKMSVWPVLTRYKAGSDSDEDDVDNANDRRGGEGKEVMGREKEGFRIVRLGCAAVVCYFGESDRSGKASVRTDLRTHVEEKKRLAREIQMEREKEEKERSSTGRSTTGEGASWGAKRMATLAMVMAAGWVWKDALLAIDFSEPVAALFGMASIMR